MTTKGFDELQKRLKTIEKNAKQLDGKQDLTFDELFNADFMGKHTDHKTFSDFIDASKIKAVTVDDFENNKEFDAFVADNSKFTSWNDMRNKAVGEYAQKKILAGL